MITSVGNRTIRSVRRLRKRPWRERQGSLLVEGHRPLARALAAGVPVRIVLHTPPAKSRRAELLTAAARSGSTVHPVSPAVMRHLTDMPSPPDTLSVVVRRPAQLTEQQPPGLLLLGVRDPSAAGGVLATGAAAGIRGAVWAEQTVDPYDPKTIRAGQGAHFDVAIVPDVPAKEAVAHYRGAGAVIVSLGSEGSMPWSVDLTGPVLFVIEGEAEQAAVDADANVAVPEGPPLAARAGMLMYEWMRQRGR